MSEEVGGWGSFGQGAKKTRGYQNIVYIRPQDYAGYQIEMRIVSVNPFYIATHWFYQDVADAWLHKNVKEGLKDKYGDARKAKKWPFECPDTNHLTGKTSRETCELCTTYEEFAPWPNRSALVQVFFRIPKHPQKSLREWSKDLYTFEIGKSVNKVMGRLIERYGNKIAHPKEGWSLFITYNEKSQSDTWVTDYGAPTPLTRDQWAVYQEQKIDYNDIYEAGDPAELQRSLKKQNYDLLLDPNWAPEGFGGRGGRAAAPAGRIPAAGRPGAPAARPGGRPVQREQDLVEDYGEELHEPGLDDDQFGEASYTEPGFADGGLGDDFGDEPPLPGASDDFPEDGGYGEESFEEEPPMPTRPAARPAQRPATPAARPSAPAGRPAAPAARPSAPAQRPSAPAGRPAAPGARPQPPRRP